jgi:hypothetical protein
MAQAMEQLRQDSLMMEWELAEQEGMQEEEQVTAPREAAPVEVRLMAQAISGRSCI